MKSTYTPMRTPMKSPMKLHNIPPKKYFLHFGCWNNNALSPNSDLSKTISLIKSNYTSTPSPPEFILIAGDNYYPVKVSKQHKKLNVDELKTGFRMLPSTLPIYMNFGNHDLETGLFLNDTHHRESNCTITREELSITAELNNIRLALYQSVPFSLHTVILMIDSNLFDDVSLHCYRFIINEQPTEEMVIANQKQFIRSTIEQYSAQDNIVFVAHHPIIEFKVKKTELMTVSVSKTDMLCDLLFHSFDLLAGKTVYYLCADLHHYQQGSVEIKRNSTGEKLNIRQYIVGTGGAVKDPIPPIKMNINDQDNVIEFDDYTITYYMNDDDIDALKEENGVLKCEEIGETLKFQFVGVNSVVEL